MATKDYGVKEGSLRTEIAILDIIVEYLSVQLAKYRRTRIEKRKELKLCLDLAKHQKET